ncbi:hypothetical protein [Amycolatopsis sp. Hca4]|uniref:hypothetical protein n=1 Tax=Amycolatopsis sp. Hca4 TaxID=2742131 RepID=UPI0015904F14|nr:hypothetical protein [Amycolatopsis sp. Hca4]QKV79499.1 hypothetical protein HUT10_41210 [Amycolatopsis sp. Hca4]
MKYSDIDNESGQLYRAQRDQHFLHPLIPEATPELAHDFLQAGVITDDSTEACDRHRPNE